MSIHRDEKSSHNSSHMSDVSKNISKFRGEGIPQKQAVAKALSIGGRDDRGRSKKK